MFDGILTVIGLAFLLFGLFVFFSAVLGLYRLDYVLNRMHAAAVGDALGIFCAVAAPLCTRLLTTVIVYMAFSLLMAVLWSLLQTPDLAITEAAVGAGITSILFFLTLKKLHALKGTRDE